jgi:hypothetical protein
MLCLCAYEAFIAICACSSPFAFAASSLTPPSTDLLHSTQDPRSMPAGEKHPFEKRCDEVEQMAARHAIMMPQQVSPCLELPGLLAQALGF